MYFKLKTNQKLVAYYELVSTYLMQNLLAIKV
jgi:hypothetical protein